MEHAGTGKRQINNISAVVIVYRREVPAELFLEVKDRGYPFPRFQGGHCIIGGNWIGEKALADTNTYQTARREVNEELTFDKPLVASEELAALGFGKSAPYVARGVRREATTADQEDLNLIKTTITEDMVPWRDILQIVPAEIHDGKRPGTTTLCSYWSIGLPDAIWSTLVRLQNQFGNLSNESVTIITSVRQMIDTNLRGTWGHDQALRRFLIERGVPRAEELPYLDGITIQDAGPALPTYDHYLERFDVQRKPVQIAAR